MYVHMLMSIYWHNFLDLGIGIALAGIKMILLGYGID